MQREKALAEAEGRAREARENEDINRRALTLRLEEERKKLVEAINTTFGSASTRVLMCISCFMDADLPAACAKCSDKFRVGRGLLW